jgi:hypothetical protein
MQVFIGRERSTLSGRGGGEKCGGKSEEIEI